MPGAKDANASLHLVWPQQARVSRRQVSHPPAPRSQALKLPALPPRPGHRSLDSYHVIGLPGQRVLPMPESLQVWPALLSAR